MFTFNEPEVMNIYAKNGHKVIFAYPTHGRKSCQKLAERYLEHGEIYTVDFTDVGQSHTNVFLKEFPHVGFNSVLFKDAQNKEDE